MDDSCAVCAEALEWVAYGPCGHRDVCSTCVARLRFICDDRHCCICKDHSDFIFVTKALGDYTTLITDFSAFPPEPKEGRASRSYWYHEDTQAFFDDADHYKMVKAMCKLSCNICDAEQPDHKRRPRFGNIEHLKGHLFHKHRSFMCTLCLEGRKAFVCEQKLYNRAQLNQHIKTGDSEVDGTESQRGGFSGHPMCEFCKTPFYGDNELYTHMSSEHYTCHICQRQHPGQYEYYNNYDDLEMHFRQSHYLCEDEACLAKKFIVFQYEAEMKRHNTVEHAGRMSRSKRNAALQIPTSFRYNRSNEQDHRRGRGSGRGRGRTFSPDFSENQLSMAIEASLETGFVDDAYYDPSTGAAVPHDTGDPSDVDSVAQSLNSLSTADSEASSRYLQALGNSSQSKPFKESLFPPLSAEAGSSQPKPTPNSDGFSSTTMAEHLRRQKKRNPTVVNSGQAWSPAGRGPPSNSAQAWPTVNATVSGVSWGSNQNKVNTTNVPGSSTYSSSAQARPTLTHVQQSTGSSRDKGNPRRITHSASAPNLVENGSSEPSLSDFPPVSAAVQARPLPPSNQTLAKSEDAQTANKSLVEMIRTALEFDEDKYTAFKDISGQYRLGTIDANRYLSYVRHINLTHLVLDLARLCPDSQKQKELIETYNASVRSSVDQGSDWAHSNGSKKGKAKVLAAKDDSSKDMLADNFLSTVRKLQSGNNYKHSEEVEVLLKDGYRGTKGKSKLMMDQQPAEVNNHSPPAEALTNYPSGGGGGGGGSGSKPRGKKTSKFLRVRLGDGSLSDLGKSGTDLDSDADAAQEQSDGNDVLGPPVRGVWRKGGGQKLFP